MSKSKEINLSIIMSDYNTDAATLMESVTSILDQDFKNFELIIVNDCSANDLENLSYIKNDSRVRVLKNKKNMGLVYSLNKAAQEATSNLLVRMDTDDIALPNRLGTLYAFAKEHPEYSVIGSCAIEFSETGDIGILGKAGEKRAKEISLGDTMIHPSVIINKEAFLNVGGYPNFHRAEDLALWCEMLLSDYRLFVIPDILLKYRVNGNDYRKRKLKNRHGEIKARIYYYPKLKVGPISYLRIAKSIVVGVIPVSAVRLNRQIFIINGSYHEK